MHVDGGVWVCERDTEKEAIRKWEKGMASKTTSRTTERSAMLEYFWLKTGFFWCSLKFSCWSTYLQRGWIWQWGNSVKDLRSIEFHRVRPESKEMVYILFSFSMDTCLGKVPWGEDGSLQDMIESPHLKPSGQNLDLVLLAFITGRRGVNPVSMQDAGP